MLKGISPIIPPELLKILDEMGHGDRIVFADSNYPVESCGKESKVVRCDGHKMSKLLEGVLNLFPLDSFYEAPVILMATPKEDNFEPPIWKTYASIVSKEDARGKNAIKAIDRFDFYEESKKAYAIVATGEMALYASVILQKGIITE
ncbi:MAG: RbsD/FucU domain-containing protein [Sphaerochaetaceae bacterium]